MPVCVHLRKCAYAHTSTFHRTCPWHTHAQATDADIRGELALFAESTPVNFVTCNNFVIQPDEPCLNPPRSNTLVRSYSTGRGVRCSWKEVGDQIASECFCAANAALNPVTGDCTCTLGFYGFGRRFCYPVGAPIWREYYGAELTGESGPQLRYGHGWVTVGDTMWLFGGLGEEPRKIQVDETNDANATDDEIDELMATESAGTANGTSIMDPVFLGDVHVFSARFYSWTSYGNAEDFGGPSPRAHHAMASWDRYVFVHGGLGANDTVFGDFFMLDTYTDAVITEPLWSDLSPVKDSPAPRCRHAMAAVTMSDGSGVLYIYGGVKQLDESVIGELYEFDIGNKVWRQINYEGGPAPRAYHA
jgi:hypothetical protein